MNDALFIAQVAAEAIAPFARDGIIGGFIAWLCVRVEKRLDRHEHTLKGLAMGILMDLSTRKVLAPVAQRMVDEALRKMGVNPDEV